MKYLVSYIYIVLLLVISSCSSPKLLPKEIQGRYIQEKNRNVHLDFNGNSFAFIDSTPIFDLALYTCCDTIAYGNWALENNRGLICLNSPEFINCSVVDMQVTEKIKKNTDTLYFYINNPIEEHYKKYRYNTKGRDIYYKISIDARNIGLLDNVLLNEYDANIIKILKPKGTIIDKFSISIYPKSNFGGRNIATREVNTLEYHVKKVNTNVFEVNMPLLNYGYMSYLRLYKDFVKVISKNTLEWNNHIYTK